MADKWQSVLIVAGNHGVIRLIQPDSLDADAKESHLIGHPNAVNQVVCSTVKPYLLASASRDRSFKLWNIQTKVCIASFHGIDAHRDEVVTIDFDRKCDRIVSAGCDHYIAIWDLTEPSLAAAITASQQYDALKSDKAFKTLLVSFPMFGTRDLHLNYIDCVRFFGDLILSKVSEHRNGNAE